MGFLKKPATVVVFAREPVLGQVKTRLAAAVGPEGALLFYKAFVADLLAELAQGTWHLQVAVSGDPQGFAKTFSLDPQTCFAQIDGDLGQRMEAVFTRVLASGDYDRCHIVGSDLPQLPRAEVARAEAALALGEADLVLGPARDGGYYQISLSRPQALFSEMAWSTPTVLAQTCARANVLGLRVALLAELFDIDTGEDLQDLQEWLEGAAPEKLPRTRAAFRQWASI